MVAEDKIGYNNNMSKLSFISASDRKYVISRALALIKSDVISSLKDKSNVVVKPYCYYSSDQLSSTHVEALDAVLEFIAPHIKTQIVLAEATTIGKTLDAFKNYDYFSLQELYDFAVVDLNDDEVENITLANGSVIKIPSTLYNADAIISVCPPRYDQRMLFAGALVNILEPIYKLNSSGGAIKFVRKLSLKKETESNQGEFFSSSEIKDVIKSLPLSLAVIDAYSIKKGVSSSHLNIPHWASSSTDAISNDCLACQLLGIDISKIEYLNSLISMDELEQNIVVGDDWRNHVIKI